MRTGGYAFYIAGVRLPVTPSTLTRTINGKNTEIETVSGESVNILKKPGLTTFSVTCLIPAFDGYPFAVYEDGDFKGQEFFLSLFEQIMAERESVNFKVKRTFPDGGSLGAGIDMLVALEDYTVNEGWDKGFDIEVTLNLKQSPMWKTQFLTIVNDTSVAETTERDKGENSPEPKENMTHTVGSGDSLWSLAQHYYGDGSLYMKIFEANKDKIKNPDLIYDGDTLIIPPKEE